MTKIEIKTIWGDIIFTHEKENNTIKDTLQEAVKNGANLVGANLGGANLDDWGKLSLIPIYSLPGPLVRATHIQHSTTPTRGCSCNAVVSVATSKSL